MVGGHSGETGILSIETGILRFTKKQICASEFKCHLQNDLIRTRYREELFQRIKAR